MDKEDTEMIEDDEPDKNKSQQTKQQTESSQKKSNDS